jgi:hypothetical protein
MRHILRRALVLACLAAAAPVAVTACRTGSNVARDPNARTTVRVDNQAMLDMTIYAVRFGQRIRLGTATAHSTQIFDIPRSLLTGSITPLRFIADPVGSNRAEIGEEITVSPGDQVVLTIPPA